MTNLHRLIITDDDNIHTLFSPPSSSSPCPYRLLPGSTNHQASLSILCYVILLNPHLETLISCNYPLMDAAGSRVLRRVISGLEYLREVDVTMMCRREVRCQIGMDVFFACCPAVRRFRVFLCDEEEDDVSASLSNSKWDLSGVEDVGATVRKKAELLTNLEELELWDVGETASTDELLSIFAHCPNIFKLTILSLPDHHDHDKIGHFIGVTCPRLQSLSCGHSDLVMDVNGHLPPRIMDALEAEHQLVEIRFCGSLVTLVEASFVFAIQRHSRTMRSIRLTRSAPIVKLPVAAILEECVNLEQLVLDCDDSTGSWTGLYVTLTDMLERPWRIRKMTIFALGISGCELPVDIKIQAYYARQSPITLTPQEQEHFSLLEDLYTRIGTLHNLEYLTLEVVALNLNTHDQLVSGPIRDREERSFPGMLSLKDLEIGRPGYLNLFAGLRQLRSLRGSVSGGIGRVWV